MVRSKKPSATKYPWLLTWGRWLVFGLIFGLFLLTALDRLDPDFGWHLREGQDFLNGVFPAKDQYNYNAADYSWAAHEWLSDIVLAMLYGLGGYPLVAVVWGLFFTAGFYFVGRGKCGPAVLAAFLVCLAFIGVRTVVFAVFGLGFLIFFMDRKLVSWLKLALIPVVILVWSWLHGSFLVGLVYLFYRAIFVEKSWRIALAAVVGGLATVLNPFGLKLWHEIISIVTDGQLSLHITEWRLGIDYWTIAPLLAIWVMNFMLHPPASLKLQRQSLKNYLYFARFDILLFWVSFRSVRNYPLFALSAIDSANRTLLESYKITRKTKPARRLASALYIVLVVGLFGVVLSNYFPVIQDMVKNRTLVRATSDGNGYPNQIVKYLNDQPCHGNLFNHYDIGGYLIWKLPSQKVYVDGRMGTTWSRPGDSTLGSPGENYYEIWSKINYGQSNESAKNQAEKYIYTPDIVALRNEVFSKFTITCVVTNKDAKLVENLKSTGDWQEIVADDVGWVLLKQKLDGFMLVI
jgi:hypothetical protein